MGGTGVEMRMKLLRDAADQQLVKPLHSHGWAASVTQENPVGEYLIVEGTKSGITRRVALLYSSATDNKHYKVLDAAVDFIFTNGALYLIDQFAYGIRTGVAPVSEFFPVSWHGIRSWHPRKRNHCLRCNLKEYDGSPVKTRARASGRG